MKFMNIVFKEVVLKTDNKGASNKLGIKQSYSGIKQMEIEYFFCKDILQKEKWKILYTNKTLNDADVFTKPVGKQWFLKNREKWMHEARKEN
eukprot:snap_masked-scaffold_39-processed-gene-1.36-mRNA-1 protein AED:1.00 eAED:1.00 QI:0/-1/0/0/-1/1/1/0/91